MSTHEFGPVPGSAIFHGVAGKKAIVMAANIRIGLVAEGIFQAAKDADSAVFMELARSESDLSAMSMDACRVSSSSLAVM